MAEFTRFLSGAEAYLDRVGRWTPSTRVGYGVALAAFAELEKLKRFRAFLRSEDKVVFDDLLN